MKQIFALTISLLFLLFALGCESPSDEAGVPEETPDETPEEPAEEGPMMGRVSEPIAIDGSNAGYPSAPLEAAGITVYLAHDGSTLYAYAEADAGGWLAIGFNTTGGGMNGANIIIAGSDNDSNFRDDVGVGQRHNEVDVSAVEDLYFSYDNGKAIMEFSYALTFPEDQGYNVTELVPGETYALIVALHSSADDFARQHSSRGSINFEVEQ